MQALPAPASTRSRPWPICPIAARRPSTSWRATGRNSRRRPTAAGDRARASRRADRRPRAFRPRRPVARAAPRGARRTRGEDVRRHGLRLSLRPRAAAPLDRVPGRRGQSRSQLLRLARLRGAPGELRRDRQGRRAGAALVSARARPDAGRPRFGADLMVGIDVRVPDAVAGDARAGGEPAGADEPPRRPPADEVRRRAWRAVGRLGIGVQCARSGAHLSVLELRRPRPGAQARTQRRRRRRSLRDGAGGDGGSAGRGAEFLPSCCSRRPWPIWLVRGSGLHAGAPSRRRAGGDRPRLHGAPPRDDPGRDRQRAARRRHARPLSRRADHPSDGALAAGTNPARRRGCPPPSRGGERRPPTSASSFRRCCAGSIPRTTRFPARTCSRTAGTP